MGGEFDFSKAEVLEESGETKPVDTSAVNLILRLDAAIREKESRLSLMGTSSEVIATVQDVRDLAEERDALELNLDRFGRVELRRLRSPTGGV